jgi:hypothetical protein
LVSGLGAGVELSVDLESAGLLSGFVSLDFSELELELLLPWPDGERLSVE